MSVGATARRASLHITTMPRAVAADDFPVLLARLAIPTPPKKATPEGCKGERKALARARRRETPTPAAVRRPAQKSPAKAPEGSKGERKALARARRRETPPQRLCAAPHIKCPAKAPEGCKGERKALWHTAPILDQEAFDAVQQIRNQRSNVYRDEVKSHR